jgi:hypothetical protein
VMSFGTHESSTQAPELRGAVDDIVQRLDSSSCAPMTPPACSDLPGGGFDAQGAVDDIVLRLRSSSCTPMAPSACLVSPGGGFGAQEDRRGTDHGQKDRVHKKRGLDC